MAVEYGWTGWENGEADACISPSPVRGGVVGAGRLRPRTGQNYLSFVSGDSSTNVWASYQRKNVAFAVGVASATTKARTFFRVVSAPGSNSCGLLCIGTPSSSGSQDGNLSLNTNLTFKVWSFNQFGAASAAVLVLERWYRADLTHTLTQSGANVFSSTSCSVYEEDGTLVETVSAVNSGTPIATLNMPEDVAVGNGTAFSSTCHNDFDDLWWGTATGADEAGLAFPTATRVTRVYALAQGSVAQWTGDFRTTIDAPMQTATADEQSNAVATQQTLFTKDTAAALGLSGIEGVIVAAQLRSIASSGNESLMLGGVAYTVPVTTAFGQPRKTGVNYASISNATFDGWEFGARNDRGTGLRLGNCYLDVLHSGSSIPAPYTDVSDVFRIQMVTWTGNGGYQTVTGMGFGAQVLLICPQGSTLNVPSVFFARSGGTRGISFAAGAQDTRNGILQINDDGFLVGPNNNVNQSGQLYMAIGIRDGGQGVGGFHMDSIGGRMGNLIDGYNVVFGQPFTPSIAWNQNPVAGGGSHIKTTPMPASDFSIGFSGNPGGVMTNLIQLLNADGYQVGSASGVNGNGTYNLGMIIRIGSAAGFIHVGTHTPTGTTATITGIPFTPIWVGCQQQAKSTSGFYRSSLLHATANSTQWSGGLPVANGITALTADGFTIGSQLSANGIPVYWIALAPGAIPAGGCVVNLASGADAGGIPGCVESLGNGADSGGIAGCRVSLAN